MKTIIRIQTLTVCLCAALTTTASERLLNEAMSHDQGLTGIRDRFEGLRDRQADSRVFSEAEMSDANLTIDTVETVREEQVAEMILALGESVHMEDPEKKRELYAKVAEDYNIAIETLEKVVQNQGKRVKAFAEKRDLLESQKAILRDLEELSETLAKGEGMNEKTVDELARLAQEQEEAAEKSEDPELGDRMEEAAESMKKAEVEQAIERTEDLVAELEKELDDFGASEALKESETVRALEEALTEVKDIREDLEPSGEEQVAEAPMDDAERQEAAERLDDVARGLEAMEDPSQTEALESAMLDVLSQQDAAAEQTLAEVQKHLEQELDKALGQEPVDAPPPPDALAGMEEMMSELEQMSERMEEAASGESPLTEEERTELAGAMQEMSEALQPETGAEPGAPEAADPAGEDPGMPEPAVPGAAEALSQAAEQTGKGEDAPAAESLAQAQQQLAGAMAEMQAQMAAAAAQPPPPGTPGPPVPSTPSSEPGQEEMAEDKGFGDGSRNRGTADGEWTARLPEKERSALRAARQARFSPYLEPDVTRYFIELAK